MPVDEPGRPWPFDTGKHRHMNNGYQTSQSCFKFKDDDASTTANTGNFHTEIASQLD